MGILTLMGCYVDEPITFDGDPDVPPVILDVPGSKTPIGSIVWFDKGAQPSLSTYVKVREENRDQELKAHFRVVTEDSEDPLFEILPLEASGEVLRDLEVKVESELLNDGECHHLELAVSAAFFDGTNPLLFDFVPPGRESEVAYASWWIWEGAGSALATASDKARILDTCGAIEDLLMPALTETP